MAIRLARMTLDLAAVLTPPGDEAGGAKGQIDAALRWTNGTGSNQADGMLYDARTLAGGASEDLDLATLTDANGAALNPAEVAAIAVLADAGNSSTVTVAEAASAGLSNWLDGGSLKIGPGGVLVHAWPADGGPAVSPSNKAIAVTNDDGSAAASYTLLVLTRSA